MAAWSALYPHILPFVRGCDTDVVDFHLRQAAIEFCRRSQCWRQEILISSLVNEPTYVIPLPTGSVASMLLKFTVINLAGIADDNYNVVAPERGRELDREYCYSAYAYLSDDGLSITVAPKPDNDDIRLTPYLSLKPSQSSAGLPDFLVDQYADAIAAGALSKLLDMPHTAWRDIGKSSSLREKFEMECGNASVRTSRGAARSRTRSRGCFY